MRIADLGTGSGAIALAIAHERPRAHVTATDASRAALDVARGNAARLGIGNVAFAQGDWFAALGGERFDLIVSNPPYIAADDAHLDEGDLRFEPAAALVLRRGWPRCDPPHHRGWRRNILQANGSLLFEHGWDQAARVRALFDAAGYD